MREKERDFPKSIGKQYLITRPELRDESLVQTGLPQFQRKECRAVDKVIIRQIPKQ
jgi:hypothetical protein